MTPPCLGAAPTLEPHLPRNKKKRPRVLRDSQGKCGTTGCHRVLRRAVALRPVAYLNDETLTRQLMAPDDLMPLVLGLGHHPCQMPPTIDQCHFNFRCGYAL